MKKQINEARFQFLAGVISEGEFNELNENEPLPTIQSISKTDLPIMVGKGKTLQVKLSNGKTHFVSPGDLEGIYGGDSDDLDYFVGQEWDQ